MINTLTRQQLQEQGRIAHQEIPVAMRVPYSRLVNDTTVRTRDGYLIQVLEVAGLSFETADQISLDSWKHTRATLLHALADSHIALYTHIIRQEVSHDVTSSFDNDFCRELDDAYHAQLSDKKMFINRQYLTLVYRPAKGKINFLSEIARTISRTVDSNEQKLQEAVALEALTNASHKALQTLKSYGARILGEKEHNGKQVSELLSFFYYLLNFSDANICPPQAPLNSCLGVSRLSFGQESFEVRGAATEHVRQGAILSLKSYPTETGAGMLDHVLRLPHSFIITQSFAFASRQSALSAMKTQKRKIAAGEEGAYSLEDSMNDAIDTLASGHAVFGGHHLTIAVHADNAHALKHAVSDVIGSCADMGTMVFREDMNMEASLWAQLPGNMSYIARRSLISNRNFAGFSSFHTFPSGKESGNHWGDAVSLLETTSGTHYWFNFHHQDTGNFTVIGPTGTGKTVLLTFLMAQAQRLKPRTFYFDKDRGAELFIRALDGKYTIVKAGQPTGLNPFQLPDSPENRAFLRDFLKVLATTDNDTALSSEDEQVIHRVVEANYNTDHKHRRLLSLSGFFSGYTHEAEHSLEQRLSKWFGKGERAWLFDNEQDNLHIDNYSMGFDLTSILDDPIARTPWLMYIFHRINSALNGERTMIILDEGWKMLDDPVFSQRIKDWEKTIRKQNGILGFATQSAQDAIQSSIGRTIIEQSPTQIFLPNPRASKEDYCEGFGLSEHEWRLVREMPQESRNFLIRHHNDSVIAKLDLQGMDDFIAILSGRTETVLLADKLRAELGEPFSNWREEFHQRRKNIT